MKQPDYKTALGVPFPRKDIEFRVSRASPKTKKLCVLAYITARAIMDRLDSVFGIEGWKDEYEVLPTGVKCRLAVRITESWISKEDVAPFTNIEALKGAFSDSLKRAGVKFGIGRYLYELPEYWVDLLAEKPREASFPTHYHNSGELSGYWVEPQLPDWALPDQSSLIPAEYQSTLEELLQRQLLTPTKYESYRQALAHPQATVTQKAVIWEQLALIQYWGQHIPQHPDLNQEQKRVLYRNILNSNSKTIGSVRAELQALARPEEAA